MPELPEVETVRRGLAEALSGALIEAVEISRPDLRFPFPENFARRLAGQRITGVARRAKYLLIGLDGGETWLAHLGMTGSFAVARAAHSEPLDSARHRPPAGADSHRHFHARLTRPGGEPIGLSFSDARRFGFMDLLEDPDNSRWLSGLGPEPLDRAFGAAHLAAAFAGRRTSVKSALLDQRVVAGIGNIYASEALWRARISPRRLAAGLVTRSGAPGAALARLAQAIKEVLGDAIAAGGSSLKDFRHAGGELGEFQHQFAVYDRAGQPCPRCQTAIRRIMQAGRASYYCTNCQR